LVVLKISGRAIFSPISTNAASTLPRTWRNASSETQMPAWRGQTFEACGVVDGVAENVAVLATTSPTMMPMRNSIRVS
jgi:hypothetical protein